MSRQDDELAARIIEQQKLQEAEAKIKAAQEAQRQRVEQALRETEEAARQRAAAAAAAAPAAPTTVGSISKAAAAPAPATAPAAAPAAPGQVYQVKAGDTLAKIAKQFYGDATLWSKIFEANRDQLKNPDLIQVGQKLRIP